MKCCSNPHQTPYPGRFGPDRDETLCWNCAERFFRAENRVPEPLADAPYWHLPALVEGKPQLVAFYQNGAHFRADRRTEMKIRRYLRKYMPEHGEDTAEAYELLSMPKVLHFARTADEIEDVYLNGPRSCMAHTFDNEHPTRVYASGDLAVAYTTDDNTPEGKIQARTVVRPDKKAHTTVYGDRRRMEWALDAAGYEEDDKAFVGAKIVELYAGNGRLILPYFDFAYGVSWEDGAYRVADRYPEYAAKSEDGVVSCCDEDCHDCGECVPCGECECHWRDEE